MQRSRHYIMIKSYDSMNRAFMDMVVDLNNYGFSCSTDLWAFGSHYHINVISYHTLLSYDAPAQSCMQKAYKIHSLLTKKCWKSIVFYGFCICVMIRINRTNQCLAMLMYPNPLVLVRFRDEYNQAIHSLLCFSSKLYVFLKNKFAVCNPPRPAGGAGVLV